MAEPNTRLGNRVREHRDALGLSQQGLADLVGVSRQAVLGVERGRRVPSTVLALRLAAALGCSVEDLFQLSAPETLPVRLAASAGGPSGARVAVGSVDGAWVAHRLPLDPTAPADGILVERRGGDAHVQPLAGVESLRRNVIVAGCAPVLAALTQRVGARFADARATWIPANSGRALDLLADGLVHAAGLHAHAPGAENPNEEHVHGRFPGEAMLVVNLTRWREGLVLPPGNPRGVRGVADLAELDLCFAHREAGAEAGRLVARLLEESGHEVAELRGPEASGHAEVAGLVGSGAADAGIAIEGVAMAAGLHFVPLTDERFDLVLRAEQARRPPVSRLLDTLDDEAFQSDMAELPGYDGGITGHVTALGAG